MMMKVTKPTNEFDKELAAKGKKRVQVAEVVALENGSFATCYREHIVKVDQTPVLLCKKEKKLDTANVLDVKEVKAKAPRAARKGTKLDRVVEFVKTSDAKSKGELVSGIVDMLGVTEANAKVYLYKAVHRV